MLKINTVTMKNKIEEILKNSYTKFGEFDESKATKELLNLFDVSVSFNNEELKVIKTDIKHIVDRVILNEKDEFIRFQILDKLNER